MITVLGFYGARNWAECSSMSNPKDERGKQPMLKDLITGRIVEFLAESPFGTRSISSGKQRK